MEILVGTIVFSAELFVRFEGIVVEFLFANVFFGRIGVKSIVKFFFVVGAVFVVHRATILS